MRLLIVPVLSILGSSLMGQGVVWTLPPGYLSAEADGWSRYFGTFADGRSMLLDAQRTQRFTLKEMAFRPDYQNYALYPAMGRRWSGVTLRMAEADMWSPTVSFSQKLRTSQTLVFSGAMAWPTMTALPATRPVPFSIRFPFTSPWTYTGVFDMSADFQFSGGVLANRGVWGGYYPLDLAQSTGSTAVTAQGVAIGNPGCIDSAATRPATFSAYETMWHPLMQQDIGLSFSAEHGAPSSVLFAIGVGGTTTGIAFPGVGCQRLFVDTALPTIYAVVAPTAGVARFGLTGRLPASYVGAELWGQAAWSDSRTGALRFTPAARQGLFAPHTGSAHLEMFGVGNTGGTSRIGGPLCRYTR